MKTKILLLAFVFYAAVAKESDRYNEVVLSQQLTKWSEVIAATGPKFLDDEKNRAQVYKALEGSVSMVLARPDPFFIDSITRFAAEIAMIDNSAAVGTWMLPLWRRHSQEILLAAHKLSTPKRLELLRQIKVRLQEAREGNG